MQLLVVLLATITVALCAPIGLLRPELRVVMEDGRRTDEIEGWRNVGRASPGTILDAIVCLSQQNQPTLDRIFEEVTNPFSPKYGHWLSLEEVISTVAPPPSQVRKVEEWLRGNDVEIFDKTIAGDMLFIRASVTTLSSLLQTRFHAYLHERTGTVLVKSEAYSLPAEIAAYVDLISGLVGLPQITEKRTKRVEDVAEPEHVTPAVLRTRYNVTDVGTNESNSVAVAEFVGQYFSPSDLTTFFQKEVGTNVTSTVAGVVGNNNPRAPGIEAALDIEYVMGVAQDVPAWFVIEAGGGTFTDFFNELMAWAGWLNNGTNVPLVHSVSYGDQYESQPSAAYKYRLAVEMQKAGLRGISIIFASGDYGTGCFGCKEFQASFPATIPYVTSVGATQFISGNSGAECASVAFPSGGGFSNHFAMPSWQATQVQHYLSTARNLPPSTYFNSSGRATPDVSALGVNFVIVQDGVTQVVDGTSCSAPTFAGIVALLNQARFQRGKSSLGFLNPWLYAAAEKDPNAFFDVTEGQNKFGCCHAGFPAAPGWDAVTGLGTPNYELLKTLV